MRRVLHSPCAQQAAAQHATSPSIAGRCHMDSRGGDGERQQESKPCASQEHPGALLRHKQTIDGVRQEDC